MAWSLKPKVSIKTKSFRVGEREGERERERERERQRESEACPLNYTTN